MSNKKTWKEELPQKDRKKKRVYPLTVDRDKRIAPLQSNERKPYPLTADEWYDDES